MIDFIMIGFIMIDCSTRYDSFSIQIKTNLLISAVCSDYLKVAYKNIHG